MEDFIPGRRRIGLVISSIITAIYINGEARNTSLVCIAMILKLWLGRNLKLMVSLIQYPILVQSSEMETGYFSQDGMALKTPIKFGV